MKRCVRGDDIRLFMTLSDLRNPPPAMEGQKLGCMFTFSAASKRSSKSMELEGYGSCLSAKRAADGHAVYWMPRRMVVEHPDSVSADRECHGIR